MFFVFFLGLASVGFISSIGQLIIPAGYLMTSGAYVLKVS